MPKNCSEIEKFSRKNKKKIFHFSSHNFCPKVCSKLTCLYLKLQINPKIKQQNSVLVVITHAQLKLFLYGNIVSINSTIYGATYGLHGGKKSKFTKSVLCTTDNFSQSVFLRQITSIFTVLRKKIW